MTGPDTPPPGILALFNSIAPDREAEYEEWFQHQHLAERLAVPGFLLGRRHEVVRGEPRYFNFYVTQSADVLRSSAYRARLDNPTPMTRMIMSEVFKDMSRTICHRSVRLGAMRGAIAVAARFSEAPADGSLQATAETLVDDRAVACSEVWTAASARQFPASEEERLRGGDRRIAACLLIETLRLPPAEKIAEKLADAYPQAEIGIYRLLCEIRP